MSEVLAMVFGVTLALWVGYVIGQHDGVSSAARGCEKVGAFYTKDLKLKCEVMK